MADFRQQVPSVGFSAQGRPPKVRSLGSVLSEGLSDITSAVGDAQRRAGDRQEAENASSLGRLEADILQIEADKRGLTFNGQSQISLNAEAQDAGLDVAGDDPSMDDKGIEDLNRLAKQTKTLGLAANQGKNLSAADKALKLTVQFTNQRPDLSADAVKIFKRNFGAAPTQLRLQAEKQEQAAFQAEQARREKVGREVLGLNYENGKTVNENWATVLGKQADLGQIQTRQDKIDASEANAQLSQAEKKENQIAWTRDTEQNRAMNADEADKQLRAFIFNVGAAGRELTRDEAVQVTSQLDEAIERQKALVQQNMSLLPAAERAAMEAVLILPFTQLKDRLLVNKDAANLDKVAANTAKILSANARLENPMLNLALETGLSKFDPSTLSNLYNQVKTQRTAFGDAVIATTAPETNAQAKMTRALYGTPTPSFASMKQGAEEAGLPSSRAIKGLQEMNANEITLSLTKDATINDQHAAANRYISMFTAFALDGSSVEVTGEDASASLKDKEQALLTHVGMSDENFTVLQEQLTDKQKEQLAATMESYSTDVLAATADLLGERLGAFVVDGELEPRDPVSLFSRLGDAVLGGLGLVPDAPSVPRVVGELVDFDVTEGGGIRFFAKSQESNPAVARAVLDLNANVADRFKLISKTIAAGKEVGIPSILAASKAVTRELAEEGLSVTPEGRGISQEVSGELREALTKRRDQLTLTKERLEKRLASPERRALGSESSFITETQEDLAEVNAELTEIAPRLGTPEEELPAAPTAPDAVADSSTQVFDFTRSHELGAGKKFNATPTVPVPRGASPDKIGVTVATGFDVGQFDEASVREALAGTGVSQKNVDLLAGAAGGGCGAGRRSPGARAPACPGGRPGTRG